MGKIDYRAIYETNKDEWKALTREPQKYEALLAGHYSESNHFVYELLQNAEDERADRVVIEYYDDKLIFYHNGEPFDQGDVRGVSSMLMGTKDRNDAQTIGRFGMGFKSVFKYTYQPEIYSDDEAFRIENYLLPVEIEDGWDFRTVKEQLGYKRTGGGSYHPFAGQKHLTKIVIPFLKRNNDGSLKKVPGKEVLQKLEELTGEILLFLNHIESLYWVNKNNGKFAMISLDEDQTDHNLVTCRIEGSAFGNKENITRYLKFKKVFNHPDMNAAEVSVAYKVNRQANNVNELTGSVPVWVYFPTRDMTKLPFYIHGAFETAVSREKLMTPSDFNSDLFDELGNLICDSLHELKNRKLITQHFIRYVIMSAFKDESDNNTIPGLREKITEAFKTNAILPDRDGSYRMAKDLSIPVPFGISEFCGHELVKDSLENAGYFVAFNNEKELNFNEYFAWLVDDLKVKKYTLADWAKNLCRVGLREVEGIEKKYKAAESFYDFLSDNRESLYSTGLHYSRSGRYEQSIRMQVSEAWEQLRCAPIVLNAMGEFVPAYCNDKRNLYLSGSNDYKTLVQSAVVHKSLAEDFGQLLKDGFQLSNFDNFQYVKEKVIKKYVEGDKINFETEDTITEYVEDINQVINLFENYGNAQAVLDIVKDASIIRIKQDENGAVWSTPSSTYVSKSMEGIDLSIYYAVPLEEDTYDEDEDDYYEMESPDVYPIDESFYDEQGIPLKKLYQFGVVVSPITEGRRSDPGGPGQESWKALGEYCPRISADYIDENLRFISRRPNLDLAKKKSVQILKLVIEINQKLSGRMRKRKSNPYEIDEESYLLTRLKRYHSWLYDKTGNVHSISRMSKYDLNPEMYGSLNKDKEIYTRLGFMETEEDNTAEAFEQVDKLDAKNKTILLRQLARELGMKISDGSQDEDEEFFGDEDTFDGDDVFDGSNWVSDAFPISRIRNMDSLIERVRQQFFCADPVKYEKVWRQMRTSKSSRTNKAYVSGMYVNESNAKVCQMCKKPVDRIDATEIANYGIELPQLHLCLCKDCSANYKSIRDVNKEAFKEAIKQAILGLNLEEKSDEYEIQLNNNTSICFTETHVAEVQTIFGLISEYGIPRSDEEVEDTAIESLTTSEEEKIEEVITVEEAVIEEKTHDEKQEEQQEEFQQEVEEAVFMLEFMPNTQPIKEGDLVSYKKMNTLEIVDAVMDTTKYPLHKSFIGKKIGDLVVANGKRFIVVSIL